MKRKIFLLIMSLCAFSVFINAQEQQGGESQKTNLELSENEFGNESRDASHVEAYLYPSLNLIEVEAYGIGDADIYVTDASGNVVNYVFLDSDLSCVTIGVPDIPGNYCLVIRSGRYHGEALFRMG